MKKTSVFILLLFDFVLFIVLFFCAFFSDSIINLNIINIYPLNIIPKFIIYILLLFTLIFLPILGNLYRAIKEKEDFNEFGVRKKKAKRKLSSYNREIVEAQQLAENEKIVSTAALNKAITSGSKDPEEDLKKLIGLNEAKLKIEKMKARIEFEMHSKNKSAKKEMLHMIFYGSPGTGKTTMARIVAGFLYDYGYIKYNKVFETDGNFLKSNTAANTERKVKMILDKSKGGVLFIDEAYALTQSHDAAGKQAIASLIKEMEDHPDNCIIILAGYTNEMKELLDSNPGFRSRIKEYIFFNDYEINELHEIAILFAGNKGFSIHPNAFLKLDKRLMYEKKEKSWGNARTVRNIVEESINNHAYNYQNKQYSKENKYVLLYEDISELPPKRL